MRKTLPKRLSERLLTEVASFLQYSPRSASCGDPCLKREPAAFFLEEAQPIRQFMALVARNGGQVTTSVPWSFPAARP